MAAEFSNRYPTVPDSAGVARRDIVGFASEWFSDEALRDLETAAGEALAHCIERGARLGGVFALSCRCDGDVLTIEIEDPGTRMEFGGSPDSRWPVSNRQGYGMFLMTELVDRLDYHAGGTRIVLQKWLAPNVRSGRAIKNS